MDFFKILQSAEELLFELVSWIVLYPRTLWRIIRRPSALAQKVIAELDQEGSKRFDDMVSPPLCLILSVALGIGLAPEVTDLAANALGRWVQATFYNQMMLSALTAATVPLMLAVGQLRHAGQAIDRESLRRPFYLQAYLVSPLAVVLSPLLAAQENAAGIWKTVLLGLMAAAVLSYLIRAVRSVMQTLSCSAMRAIWITTVALLAAFCVQLVVALAMIDWAKVISEA